MVVTDREELARIARSIRDWGRDCYCAGGENNTCGKRFSQQFGSLPYGYDHKYVYSHLGYNLKATDMQAAIGVAQLARLDGFVAARKHNHARLLEALRPLRGPADPAGRAGAHGSVLVRLRDHRSRGCRVHPARADGFLEAEPDRDAQPVQRQPAAPSGIRGHRATGRSATWRTPIPSMNDTFFVGVYPGIDDARLDYMIDTFGRFMGGDARGRATDGVAPAARER